MSGKDDSTNRKAFPMLIVENLPIRDLIGPMSDDELYNFCMANAELRIERDSEHNIIIMSPVGGGSGLQELEILRQVGNWAKQDGSGISFSSSTGFILPDGAMRSPDASWLKREKWNQLTEKEKLHFLPSVPDFVVELCSRTDRLPALQSKCTEWIENGVQLLWLIDPQSETSWIYRADGSQEQISGFKHVLSGEAVLAGFQFDLANLYLPK